MNEGESATDINEDQPNPISNSSKRKKSKEGLEMILVLALGVGAVGPLFGLESSLGSAGSILCTNYANVRIEDTSFRKYLDSGKEQNGDGIGNYILALWTYPGARIGAEIHNWGLPKKD